MVDDAVLTPVVSAAAGGLSVAWAAKFMLGNWLKKHDKMADAVQAMSVEMGKVQTSIESFKTTEVITRTQDTKLGLLEFQIKEMKERVSILDTRMHAMDNHP